jgi:superfamily II DNA/RNA helicase
MGARGRAYTFVTREEGKELTVIEKLINKQIEYKEFDGVQDSRPAPSQGPRQAPTAGAGAVTSAPTAPPPPTSTKTLGGKFKTKRRWRP